VPVVAVVLGVVVLDEPLRWTLFAGAGVVVAGVAVAEGRLGGRTREPLPAGDGGAAETIAEEASR